MPNAASLDLTSNYDCDCDALDRIIKVTDSLGNEVINNFDANGQLWKVTHRYKKPDNSYEVRDVITKTFDAAERVKTETDADGGVTSYRYDPAGNKNAAGNDTVNYSFQYDNLNRLLNKTDDRQGLSLSFSYDKVGNRKTYTQGSLVNNANTRYYNYTTGSNRLADIRIGSATGSIESSYSHNDEGQLISQTGANAKTITWDAKGRMHSLGTETYAYDPMDYRIARSGGSLGSLDYLLEGEHLESVYQTGILKEKYFRGATVDELVAGYLTGTDGKSKPYLFHHDQLTSNTAVSGHNGGTLQATSYSAFGTTLNSTGSSPNRLKYTGRENEGNGCYYYRARYYCTRVGRFISEDPKGFAAGINFYAYVNNNPVNGNDPSGLEVAGTYVIDRNQLTIKDLNTGKSVTVQADSGGKPFGAPIEPGKYEILERAGRNDFYRLDAVDSVPGDDIHQATGRDAFRLHRPGQTIGCISVCTWDNWRTVDSIIKETSTSVVKDDYKPWWDVLGRTNAGNIIKYGELNVLASQPNAPSNSGSFLYPNISNISILNSIYKK